MNGDRCAGLMLASRSGFLTIALGSGTGCRKRWHCICHGQGHFAGLYYPLDVDESQDLSTCTAAPARVCLSEVAFGLTAGHSVPAVSLGLYVIVNFDGQLA